MTQQTRSSRSTARTKEVKHFNPRPGTHIPRGQRPHHTDTNKQSNPPTPQRRRLCRHIKRRRRHHSSPPPGAVTADATDAAGDSTASPSFSSRRIGVVRLCVLILLRRCRCLGEGESLLHACVWRRLQDSESEFLRAWKRFGRFCWLSCMRCEDPVSIQVL